MGMLAQLLLVVWMWRLSLFFQKYWIEVLSFYFFLQQSLLMIYQNFLLERPKSDIIFHRAFEELGGYHKRTAFFKGLLACELLALAIINIKQGLQSLDLIQVIIGCFMVSLLGVAIKTYQCLAIFGDNVLFLALADAQGHTTADQVTRNFDNIEDCVSKTVFIANTQLREADLDKITKNTYLNAAKRAISMELSIIFRGIASSERIHSILSVASIVYSIIELTDPNINDLNKVILSIYVVLVGLSEFLLLVGLLIICLIPFFCLIFLFYCCCCRKTRGDAINVPEKNATMQDIVNVEGDCSICYQNIAENEKVYVLPCSEKHVFHKGCLSNWTKIKQTCPICRADIPMRSGPALAEQ